MIISAEEVVLEHNKMISEIIKECDYLINNSFHSNGCGIRYTANRIKDIAKFYTLQESFEISEE